MRARAGFTLIELVIIVFLLGIMAMIVQPYLAQSAARTQVEAAAEEVAAALRYAHSVSTQSENYLIVSIKPAERRIYIERQVQPGAVIQGSHASLPSHEIDQLGGFEPLPRQPGSSEVYSVTIGDGDGPGGAEMRSVNLTNGWDSVCFYADGTCCVTGYIVVGAGDFERSIHFDQARRVTIE